MLYSWDGSCRTSAYTSSVSIKRVTIRQKVIWWRSRSLGFRARSPGGEPGRLEAGDFEAFAGPARVAASLPREADDKVDPQS